MLYRGIGLATDNSKILAVSNYLLDKNYKLKSQNNY